MSVWNQLPSKVNFSYLVCFRRSIESVDFTDYLKCNLVILFLLSVVSVCYCAYIHIYHGQLLVHCIMPCCTCSLLVHHICTRLERINDDDDVDVTIDLVKIGHDTIS